MADLGLIEEDDGDGGLGLRLSNVGRELAVKYAEDVDPGIVRWAMEEATQQKREDTVSSLGDFACLSRAPRAVERRRIAAALVGPGTTSSLQRRETLRLLLDHGLLDISEGTEETGEGDIEDTDTIVGGGALSVDAAASKDATDTWQVVRGLLELPQHPSLERLQVASAYELAALALNSLFNSMLQPVNDEGRVSSRNWVDSVAQRAGGAFKDGAASAWLSRSNLFENAGDLFDAERPWQDAAASALDTLLRVSRDERLCSWLNDARGRVDILDKAIDAGRDGGRSAAQIAEQLIFDCVERHLSESTRKGKAAWLTREGAELVRADKNAMRPGLHSLRFPQLGQLRRDLKLTSIEVSDEA